eukprot:CAMPEP_0113593292 /NCGR_PEP_ID=MMETSP0015_2-20120614/38354_1 /TAXON_ID=2838 /ORGANISM="Odontella" /LENGTH=260 /DNA_ID=CAMNT_0000499989 /DNA_START=1 /DNA_END=783 /DNA_ORIENTATION=+ /assembly_acc=CAM_ASM_000160
MKILYRFISFAFLLRLGYLLSLRNLSRHSAYAPFSDVINTPLLGASITQMNVSLPILVMGMPKTGTTTISHFFECPGRYNVSHFFCRPGKMAESKCGVRVKDNIDKGRSPLQGIENFDVYAQLDAWALRKNKKIDYKCYLPQVEALEQIHAHYPKATLLLNTRRVENWIRSLDSYNGGRMRNQMESCDIPGLPAGIGIQDSDLKTFYLDHIERIRAFARAHPSHSFLEVDIESSDAGMMMEDAFGIDHSCWGHKNKSDKQ